MSNLIGQSLGRYHILEQLGEGGMAIVYKAYDTRLEREVAVKVIRTDLFGSAVLARILQRFEREARALAKLSHPNIVKLHDYGEHDGSPFLVLEYLPSGTLKERIQRGPLPWTEAIRLLIPIADALAHAHKHGMVHRDVKSSNILLTENGSPMLTDFGIGKILESEETMTSLTGTGMGVGTPEYMAPEQWTGTAVPQSDQYALGVVLFELLTGRRPYEADTPAAILLKQANDPLPRPSKFVKDIPSSLEKVLIKALAKKPADRYKDMSAFGAALTALSKTAGEIKIKPARTEKPLQPKPRRVTEFQDEARSPRIPSLGKSARLAGILVIGIFIITGVIWTLRPSLFPSFDVFGGKPTNLPLLGTSTSTLTAAHTSTPSRTSTPTRKPTSTPSMTPTPVYVEGNVLFNKNFEDSDIGGWQFYSYPESKSPKQYWSIQQGQDENHYLVAAPPPATETWFPFGSGSWTNYAIEMRINAQIAASKGFERWLSIGFRSSSAAAGTVGYELNMGPTWHLVAGSFKDRKETWVSLAEVKIKDFTLDGWHLLRVELFGSDIKIYFDEKMVIQVSDNTSLNGSLSIGTGPGSSVFLDDIKVSDLILR